MNIYIYIILVTLYVHFIYDIYDLMYMLIFLKNYPTKFYNRVC